MLGASLGPTNLLGEKRKQKTPKEVTCEVSQLGLENKGFGPNKRCGTQMGKNRSAPTSFSVQAAVAWPLPESNPARCASEGPATPVTPGVTPIGPKRSRETGKGHLL